MERIDLTKRTSPPKRSTQSRWKQHEAYKSRVVAIDPFLPNINVITANPSLRLTDVTTLKKVPSESTVIEARARLVNQPHCVVEWKNYGCFNYKGLLQLTDIHNSRDISRKVAEEEKWIGSFSTNKDTGVEKFLQQLWHEHSPIENSERETLMGNRLLSDGCINEILEICNSQSDRQRFVMLNNMTPGNVIDTLGIDTFHIVVNVSQRNGTTHATDVGENGSHWTYMCLPTSLEGLVYCDSLGWSLPVNISRKLKPLVNKICDQRHEQFREPQTPVMLHPHNGDIHKCTPQCYDAAPLQTCGSVCGVAALMCVLGLNSNLWKTLTQTHTYSPADLAIFKEIRRPSIHSKQTRFVMMSWIGNRKVELLDLIPLQEPTCESRNTQVEPVQESQEEGATTNRNHAEPRSLPVEKIDTSPTVDVELSDLIPLQEPTCESSITQVELVQESQEEGATTNRNHTEPRSLPVEKIDTSPTVDVELSDLIPLQEPTCESSSTQVELVQESQEEGATTNRNHTEPRSLPVEKMDTSPTTDVEMSDEIEKKITRIANENNLSNSEKDSLRKKVLKRKLSDSNMESAKKKKITKQSDIKSFLKCKEDIPQLPKLEVDETNNFPSIYVSSNKLSFQYLSKKFYQSNGYAFGKNLERNCRRRVNPVLEEEGRAVGMKRTMSSVQTLQESKQQLQDCEMENNSHINSVLKTAEFIENNGPIVSTQRVCQFYMAEKNLVKRIPSCDMIEKLSRHRNIVQIYFNGIGYILDGKYSDLAKTVETLGFISENTAKHEFNKTVHSKLKNTYQTALSSMKDPYDRFILKGVLTQLTNPKFMARLEGKTNKNSYRNCRDTYNFHIENFRNIQQTSLVVKNNMTNVQQNALTKRIIQRRKLKELRIIYEGRGRTLKSTQFPELAAILEYCFGEEDVLQRAGGGLEADSRLNTAILYRAVDNNTIMKRARDVINALSPPGFKISLSTCYNYTENYREGSHQALQHHAGRGINANISLNAPQRTGVQQFVPNLHWSTANVNLQLDQADNNKDATLVDSKDAKSIICANIAPVQKTSRNWCRREYLDHDWDQSRTFAVTPSTHLFLETDRNMVIQGDNISIKVKRSGTAATVLNVSFFEPDTAFKSMNELCIMMVDPRLQEHFRDPSTHKLKEHFLFIVDNGPSTAPNNSIVKMCLARIFRLLKLKSICQVSFAEYHSKRNPVERVHAEENRALARHGPFQVKTDLTSLGSSEHLQQMEGMLKDVSECIGTGSFNGEQIVTLRGSNKLNQIFDDEAELKKFLSLPEEKKDVCPKTYRVKQNQIMQDLTMIWGVDADFEATYLEDYETFTNTSYSNKYTMKISDSSTEAHNLQPLPDFIRYLQTEELHYCDFQNTDTISEVDTVWQNVPALFLPSQILDVCFKVIPDPPSYINELIALLAWIPVEDVTRYYDKINMSTANTLIKDRDMATFIQSDLYKLKKVELKRICKEVHLTEDGSKIELIKKIVENREETVDQISVYTGDLSEIPHSVSAISSMPLYMIRSILAHHSVSTVGCKEDLILRLFMLKHKKGLLFRKEKDGLLNLIDITENLINKQRQLDILSIPTERAFPSNKGGTTRQKCRNKVQDAPSIHIPAGIDKETINKIFHPLRQYIHELFIVETEDTTFSVTQQMKEKGNTVKIKWLKEDLRGSGWQPGWYTATTTDYDAATDELTVEYWDEPGHSYKFNMTDTFAKGQIEPTKDIMAKIELYDEIMTVGTIVEMKWTTGDLKNTGWSPGWYEAEIVRVIGEEDTVELKYAEEPECIYSIEVTPSLAEKAIRVKKKYT